ncbi:hypothetical protein FQN54_004321 [Arachnomyces sp. PD_36]|nr:hypothetical protein FQN54_004321 [Arachnomyces sp. PD_36]
MECPHNQCAAYSQLAPPSTNILTPDYNSTGASLELGRVSFWGLLAVANLSSFPFDSQLTRFSFHSVFLIAATSTFLRFIHFRFGTSYLEYLDANNVATQKELADDTEKDAYVYMDSSEWFNLQSPAGRRVALCHIMALLRWHEADGDAMME